MLIKVVCYAGILAHGALWCWAWRTLLESEKGLIAQLAECKEELNDARAILGDPDKIVVLRSDIVRLSNICWKIKEVSKQRKRRHSI